MTRDHLLGWHHAAQLIADCMPAPVRPSPVRLVPVAERIGVADVDPAKEPAAPEYRCETCCDTGRVMEMVCYGGPPVERDAACPDCDGQPHPDERPAALGDGWIEWHGGECPIPVDGTPHKVRFRDGYESGPDKNPHEWRWSHAGSSGDIIAYRLLPQVAA